VAEALINPLGEDDDDFECNYIIDRNLAIGFAMVDDFYGRWPADQPPPPPAAAGWQAGGGGDGDGGVGEEEVEEEEEDPRDPEVCERAEKMRFKLE
jgi:hypothetical protein